MKAIMGLTLALTAYQSGRLAAWVTMALLLVLLVRRFIRRRRRSDAVAALVVAVLLVGGLARAGGGAGDSAGAGAGVESGAWSSAYGTNMRAGFMDGCRTNMKDAVDCRCLFSELTSRPAYSTPQGFAELAKEMEATKQVPAAYMRALDTCRIT